MKKTLVVFFLVGVFLIASFVAVTASVPANHEHPHTGYGSHGESLDGNHLHHSLSHPHLLSILGHHSSVHHY